MLPLPGAPSSSWARFCERLKAIFSGADPRVCIAFWLFGKVDFPLLHHSVQQMMFNPITRLLTGTLFAQV